MTTPRDKLIFHGDVPEGPASLPTLPRHPQVQKLMERKWNPFGTPETMALRLRCLTASDAGTLCGTSDALRGCNPYQTMHQLIAKKLGEGPEFKGNAATAHGVKYEPELLEAYERVTGQRLVRDREIGFLQSEWHTFVGATPDGVCESVPVLVEGKCPYYKREVPLDQVPDKHYPQLQVQMYVTGIPTCHYMTYVPGTPLLHGQFSIWEVRADPVWVRTYLSIATKFMIELAQLWALPRRVKAKKPVRRRRLKTARPKRIKSNIRRDGKK